MARPEPCFAAQRPPCNSIFRPGPMSSATWPRSQSIIIPIGSTEQHGPNGLIGTDALCAEAVAKGVGEKAEALVAPTISVGMAQHHLGFPGSMTLDALDPDRGDQGLGLLPLAPRLPALLFHQRPWRQYRHGDGRLLGDLCGLEPGRGGQPGLAAMPAAQLVAGRRHLLACRASSMAARRGAMPPPRRSP